MRPGTYIKDVIIKWCINMDRISMNISRRDSLGE